MLNVCHLLADCGCTMRQEKQSLYGLSSAVQLLMHAGREVVCNTSASPRAPVGGLCSASKRSGQLPCCSRLGRAALGMEHAARSGRGVPAAEGGASCKCWHSRHKAWLGNRRWLASRGLLQRTLFLTLLCCHVNIHKAYNSPVQQRQGSRLILVLFMCSLVPDALKTISSSLKPFA